MRFGGTNIIAGVINKTNYSAILFSQNIQSDN